MTEFFRKRALTLVGVHFVLACAISWSAWYLLDPPKHEDTWSEMATNPGLLLVKFGPSLAGLILIAFGGANGGLRELARTLFDLRKRPRALAGVLLLALIATVPAALIYIFAFDPSIAIPMLGVASAGALVSWIGLRTLLGGGLGEEIGWRGVTMPALLSKMGPRWSSLVLGVLWTLWHAPGFFASEAGWVVQVAAQTVLTVSLTFVFTWVYLKTEGSLSVAILLHGALNGFNAFVESSWIPALDDAAGWQIVRILSVLVLGIVAAIAMPRRQSAPDAATADEPT